MDDIPKSLPELANGVFEEILSFRKHLLKRIDVSASELRRNMDVLISEMDAAATANPRLNQIYQDRGRYVIIAFVDDVLMKSSWEHTEEWRTRHLLEMKYYGTQVAGERIPQLIAEVTGREDEAGLALLLFTCLSLGYRGRFVEGSGELEALRHKLYSLLRDTLSEGDQHITPQADKHTVAKEAKRLRPVYSFIQVSLITVLVTVVVLTTIGFVLKSRSEEFNSKYTEIHRSLEGETEQGGETGP